MPDPASIPPGVLARFGADAARVRLAREARLWARKRGFWRRWMEPRPLARLGLAVTGLSRRARREFLDIRVVRNSLPVTGLPAAFDGFRLLQISDLHCDIDPELIDRVIERLAGVSCDRCVLTGDYHDVVGRPWDESLRLMRRLVPHCGPEPVGILGNHDFLAMVAPLEEAGLRLLLNENVPVERDGARIWLCGIDDAHSFGTHDLDKVSRGIPADEVRVLLSHTPETWREAAAAGFHVLLAGHTHGGQLCLPGGIAVVKRAAVPRRLIAGPWREGGMLGYTSRGTGACSVPARLNCPAEITVHTLRRA